MRAIAIIPARGGSKRLPGKNLAEIDGRSLVEIAIVRGKDAACDVVVTTECEAVANCAANVLVATGDREEQGYLVARPPHLATDTAEIEDAMRHALGVVGGEYDAVVLLQPTSPLRRPEHIRLALQRLEEGYDSACSVTPYPHLYFGGRLRSDQTRFQPDRALHVRRRMQDLGHYAYENGAVYATATAAWRTSGMRMSGKIGAVVMRWEDSVDIDTEADLELARWLERRRAVLEADAPPHGLLATRRALA